MSDSDDDTPIWAAGAETVAPMRTFVRMKPGDHKGPWDEAPDGFRMETDAEFKARAFGAA